jgi:pyruvate dehydrogenase E1 component alpha subunit
MQRYEANDNRSTSVARSGGGPTLIEAKIVRHTGHFVGDAEAYRSKDDRKGARGIDVIKSLRVTLDGHGVHTASIVSDVEQRVVAELDAALAAARQDPWPSADEVERYVYAD